VALKPLLSCPCREVCYYDSSIKTEETFAKTSRGGEPLNRRALLLRTLLISAAGLLGFRSKASAATSPTPEFLSQPRIAREWRGEVPRSRAAEYQKYLFDEGVLKLSQIDGNLGVQMFSLAPNNNNGSTADFVVISYWPNLDAIRKYAGEDIEKPHHLPRDSEFLIKLPEKVLHYQVLVDSRV
jgi:heme-degrading monooxygenase HmoA